MKNIDAPGTSNDESEFIHRLKDLGDIFAEAFAKYTVRVMQLTSSAKAVDPSTVETEPSIPDWVAAEFEKAEREPDLAIPGDSIRAKVARDKLLLALEERGMTQADLARKLRMAPNSISRIFAQPERSRVDTLWKIADAIGVDLSDILRGHSAEGAAPKRAGGKPRRISNK